MHIVVYGGCVPRKSLGAGAVGGRARVVARERRVILLLFVASVAFGRCERCDDVTCLLVVTRTKFVIVTFFYTVSGSIFRFRQGSRKERKPSRVVLDWTVRNVIGDRTSVP